jgi:hypothetical protein
MVQSDYEVQMIDSVIYEGRVLSVLGCYTGASLLASPQFSEFCDDPGDPSWGDELATEWCLNHSDDTIYHVIDFSSGEHQWLTAGELD